jgi:hypothetical protein
MLAKTDHSKRCRKQGMLCLLRLLSISCRELMFSLEAWLCMCWHDGTVDIMYAIQQLAISPSSQGNVPNTTKDKPTKNLSFLGLTTFLQDKKQNSQLPNVEGRSVSFFRLSLFTH